MEYNFADVIREREKIYIQHCSGFCSDCPLGAPNNGHDVSCGRLVIEYPDDYAKIVMDWAEAHKPKTNGEVARELLKEKFGIEIPEPLKGCMRLGCNGLENCKECPNNGFWDKEYVGE